VVSDHGFARYDKTVSVNVALQRAGLIDVDASGRVTDWRAIMWSNALIIKEPGNAETTRTVRTILDTLVADSSSGVFRYFDDAEARKEEGFPNAAFVVGVRPGFTISGRVTGALVEEHTPAGTHGLLRELHDMDSAFFLSGAGIPHRALGRIDLRDIAPTLARLAGVSLANAQGRDLLTGRNPDSGTPNP